MPKIYQLYNTFDFKYSVAKRFFDENVVKSSLLLLTPKKESVLPLVMNNRLSPCHSNHQNFCTNLFPNQSINQTLRSVVSASRYQIKKHAFTPLETAAVVTNLASIVVATTNSQHDYYCCWKWTGFCW